MWWILLLGITDLQPAHSSSIFYSSQDANHVLKVRKRANGLFEEARPGSLERECHEEKCDLQEAKEIFETWEATFEFYSKYFDGDQCLSNPCENSVCRDGIGKFDCICNEGWEGIHCTYEVMYHNCSVNNGGCTHFCTEINNGTKRTCSCATGYILQDDSRNCKPFDNFPCGQSKIVDYNYSARLTGAKKGRKGDSPWQVMLLLPKRFICGGVLIYPYWVLTAAHCFTGAPNNAKYFVRLGEYDRHQLEDTEQQTIVTKVIIHPEFNEKSVDNDIALLRLNQPAIYDKYVLPICLPSYGLAETNLTVAGTETIVTGWGSENHSARNSSSILSYIQIPIAPHKNCSQVMRNTVTDNMLCAGILGDIKDACHRDSGGPMVTKFGDTWFLVGLVSWGEGCGRLDNFGIYTKVHHYLDWISQTMANYGKKVKSNQKELPKEKKN